LTAARAATISPARVLASRFAARYATGMVAVPASAENERSPASLWPKTCAQSQPST
jgi:hypothetical protein